MNLKTLGAAIFVWAVLDWATGAPRCQCFRCTSNSLKFLYKTDLDFIFGLLIYYFVMLHVLIIVTCRY